MPLLFAKLHSLPVVEPRSILTTELHAPGFIRCALCSSYVCLKLDSIGAGCGYDVDESVGYAQTAIVSLCDLADDQAVCSVRVRRSGRAFENVFECHLEFRIQDKFEDHTMSAKVFSILRK